MRASFNPLRRYIHIDDFFSLVDSPAVVVVVGIGLFDVVVVVVVSVSLVDAATATLSSDGFTSVVVVVVVVSVGGSIACCFLYTPNLHFRRCALRVRKTGRLRSSDLSSA